MLIRAAVAALLFPIAAAAQTPLSAIDWLDELPSGASPGDFSGRVLLEPPVTETGLLPQIEVSELEKLAQPLGLVARNVTGLPVDLWRGSHAETLSRLISDLSVASNPAMQRLLFTLLLSETLPPEGAREAETLLMARLDRLMELGAVDPARSLVEIAGPSASANRFSHWFDATLLTGDEDRACAVLAEAPHLAPDYAARIFCDARRGDWQTAALTLETAHALDLLPPDRLALLDRFLSPDIFDGAPPLPAPGAPDPLDFRLFEAIGERLPTASLPRAFATADLRDIAGWKAQIEAAERLARAGALAPNLLLGLYTARLPAASGGVWDRVAALQRFETALKTGSPDAVARTLPEVWKGMRDVRLEVPFATIFAENLADITLEDAESRELAWQIGLLSPDYEIAAQSPQANDRNGQFLTALALGEPGRAVAPNDAAQAVSDGFAPNAQPPEDLRRLLQSGRLGEAILNAMALFDSGTKGNPADLAGAIAFFRSVGMEDTARQAALQLMLLERT